MISKPTLTHYQVAPFQSSLPLLKVISWISRPLNLLSNIRGGYNIGGKGLVKSRNRGKLKCRLTAVDSLQRQTSFAWEQLPNEIE